MRLEHNIRPNVRGASQDKSFCQLISGQEGAIRVVNLSREHLPQCMSFPCAHNSVGDTVRNRQRSTLNPFPPRAPFCTLAAQAEQLPARHAYGS